MFRKTSDAPSTTVFDQKGKPLERGEKRQASRLPGDDAVVSKEKK